MPQQHDPNRAETIPGEPTYQYKWFWEQTSQDVGGIPPIPRWERVYMLLLLDSLMNETYAEHMAYFDKVTADLTLEEIQTIRTELEDLNRKGTSDATTA